MKNLHQPPPPTPPCPPPPLFPHTQIKDGKMARVGFCAASSLIRGRGEEGGGLLFYFILSKIVGWLGHLNSYFSPHAYTCVHLQKLTLTPLACSSFAKKSKRLLAVYGENRVLDICVNTNSVYCIRFGFTHPHCRSCDIHMLLNYYLAGMRKSSPRCDFAGQLFPGIFVHCWAISSTMAGYFLVPAL